MISSTCHCHLFIHYTAIYLARHELGAGGSLAKQRYISYSPYTTISLSLSILAVDFSMFVVSWFGCPQISLLSLGVSSLISLT